jgi:hypothetical protein
VRTDRREPADRASTTLRPGIATTADASGNWRVRCSPFHPGVTTGLRVIDALGTRQEGRKYMASSSKKKTTMAKLNRENAVRERRLRKQAKKDARKQAAASAPSGPLDTPSERYGGSTS